MTWTWDGIPASDSNTLDLPEEAAAWVNTYLSAQYTVLDTQTFDFDGNNYILLLEMCIRDSICDCLQRIIDAHDHIPDPAAFEIFRTGGQQRPDL